ncbi:anti-sigma factor domain-containing protein [Cryobacterium arcticum]|uniref:Transmembrane anti-sigma factor n=1 Tax=Cryobacterium arcticum TaxID=670052 RepID=A0A1B1BG09_9MICO|nr:anti-sigma factor [Cryobacterium arcticum]ANP71504.1 Transmembrane anti-sigma factor [Cryobacterium arcticum]
MTHLDRDTLALVALAELELSPQERAHLADCPGCTGELDALRRTVLIGRSAGSVDLVEPADAVWGRIHAALGLSEDVVGVPRLAAPQDAAAAEELVADGAAVRPEGPVAADATEVDPRGESDEVPWAPGAPNGPGHTGAAVPGAGHRHVTGGAARGPASVVDLGRRRRRWLPLAAAACAVGLVGGIAAGAWWQATRPPAPVPVIAEAQLDALPGWTASGSAAVEEDADGRRDVVVDLTEGDATAGLREVWLLTADATGLVSVGLLDGSSGRFSIPADLDLSQYPVVDVSAEPDDGNPAHSGDSIVRGTLHGL